MPPRKKPASAPVTIHGANIEMVALADLKPYEKNARQHPEDQLVALTNVIRDSGFTAPLIIDPENGIIAGHGRALVAKRLKMAQVPCVRVTGLSAAQIKALRLSDNQSALRGTWDAGLLLGELTGLAAEGFKMDLTAFSAFQLGELKVPGFLPEEQIERAEETPEPPAKPTVKLGEIWVLGGHRILCGDSTLPADIERLMGTERAVLMNTDPPYGINYGDLVDARAGAKGANKGKSTIKNDELDGAALQKFLEDVIRAAVPHLDTKAAFYLWHPMLTQGTFFAAAAAAADILIHRQIIWVKPSLIMGRGDYHWRHELCFYGWRRGFRCRWLGNRAQDTVWEIGRENDKIHPTQKPVELFIRPIRNHAKAGEVIYEPFSGSGSQIIAAEMEGRRCFAMELSPAYVQVAVERWQNFTGKTATREDGKTLADLQRKPKKKAA